tara:strand:- start:2311 stop:2733 length:423 start_codon:yes stop_codon:yes gene_type:complete
MKNILILAFCLVFLAGCGAEILIAPIVSGVIAWKEGEATKYYDSDSRLLYHAAKRVCKELDYTISRDDEVTEKGRYYMIAGENDRFKISITPVQPDISSVKIRINFMGDKPYAELFYKHLDEEVKIIHFDPDGNPVLISD